MGFNNPGVVVPLGAFLMVIIIMAIKGVRMMREKELQAHQELRAREMEHERRLKELDLEKAKIELEKARMGQTSDPARR